MRTKGFKTILLFISLGIFIVWFLEFRRTSLADSYWLLLMTLVFLFWYQLLNVGMPGKKADEGVPETGRTKPAKKKTSKKKSR